MINILHHGVSAAELLGRKFAASRTPVDPSCLQALGLDPLRSAFEPGAGMLSAQGRAMQLLTDGLVGEVRCLNRGRRQILSLRVPGDLLVLGEGETLVALTHVRTSDAAPLLAGLSDACPTSQALRRAWVAAGRIEQALLRNQVVRLGRMSACERLGHALLEIHERLGQVGLVTGMTFHLPLTQETLSDLAGLSVVHLNRTLQGLRREGLLGLRRGYVTLMDRIRLAEMACYSSPYAAPLRQSERPREAPRAPGLAMAS